MRTPPLHFVGPSAKYCDTLHISPPAPSGLISFSPLCGSVDFFFPGTWLPKNSMAHAARGAEWKWIMHQEGTYTGVKQKKSAFPNYKIIWERMYLKRWQRHQIERAGRRQGRVKGIAAFSRSFCSYKEFLWFIKPAHETVHQFPLSWAQLSSFVLVSKGSTLATGIVYPAWPSCK